VHIATIVLGLLIAVGLEQTVEYFHRRHEAREARENIQQEMATNLPILQFDQQEADADQRQFGKDLDLLESGASDAVVLHNLEFGGIGTRPHDAAWDAAKVNGSLALIPPGEIAGASYYYESEEELTPTVFAFFADIYTAEALLDHARTAGKLTASERQQLLSLTVSAMGHGQLISQMDSRGIQALQTSKLQ
jgi:hypothetical protein